MKITFRRALSLVCAISLLLTCLPASVLSEEAVFASDIAPDLYEDYSFLVDESEYAPYDEEEPEETPVEEASEEPSEPVEQEAPAEPAATQEEPAQQPAVVQKASAEQSSESAAEVQENLDQESAEADQENADENIEAEDGNVVEETAEETADETTAESVENAPAAPTEEADQNTEITVTDEIWADRVIVVPENAEEADLTASGDLEEGKEYVIRVTSEAETTLYFRLTSEAELQAVFATENDDVRKDFTLDVTENPEGTEENEATEKSYSLTAHFVQGSTGLIRIVSAVSATFGLQVLTPVQHEMVPADQTEEETEEILVVPQTEKPVEPAKAENEPEGETSSEEQIVEVPTFEIKGDILIHYNGEDEDVVVPEGIQEIGTQAFQGNETLKTVTLPDSVELINNAAFADCVNLEKVIRSEQSLLITIGNGAFRNDAKLDITFAESIPNVLINAFEGAGIAKETEETEKTEETEETEEENEAQEEEETEETEEETEPQEAEETEEETEEEPEEPSLVFEGEDFTVTVVYGEEAGFPEGTELTVTEILPETEEYEAYFNLTEEERAAIWNAVTEQGRLFLIAFRCGEEEVAPQAPIEVKVQFPADEQEPEILWAESPLTFEGEDYTVTVSFTEEAQLPQGTELTVRELLPETEEYEAYINLTEEEKAVIWNVVAEQGRLFLIAFLGNEEEIVPQAAVEVKVEIAEPEIHWAESPMTFEGEDYIVTVSFDEEAQIPQGTELAAQELLPETEEYEGYINLTDEERAEIWNVAVEQERFFRISFIREEEEIIPQAPIEINVQIVVTEPEIVYAESPMVFEGRDYTVTVNFNEDAGFLLGTELRVREILPGTAEYLLYSGQTEEVLSENWDKTAEFARFFDITFVRKEEVAAEEETESVEEAEEGAETAEETIEIDEDGKRYIVKEIEPNAPIDVQMTFAEVIPVATEEEEELQVQAIHFDEEEGAQVIESEAQSVEETAAADDTVVDTVAFTSGGFSVYGFVQTAKITESVISADGHTYKIEVTYGQDSEIPVNAELAVEEILPGTEQYNELLKEALKAAKAAKTEETGETEATEVPVEENSETETEEITEESETTQVADDQYARFFDIEIKVDGEKKEPNANVSVSISLADAPEVAADELTVVHFAEEGTKVLETTSENTSDIQFETDSFSVYGVIVVPPEENPVGAELDGRKVKIRNGDYYLTSEIVNGFYKKTLNSDDADIWTIYKREYKNDSGSIEYYYEFINEQNQALRLYRYDGLGEQEARATDDTSKGGTYFVITSNDNSEHGTYSMWTWLGRQFYLNEDGSNRGFGGWDTNDDNSKFDFVFQDTIGDGKQYILITHYEGDYYVILNDGSLVRIDDPVGNTVKINDPMVWQYNSNYNLYHKAKETGFDGNQLASDYFYRYLDPDAASGLTDEDYDTTEGYFDGGGRNYVLSSHPLKERIRIQYDSTNHTICSRTNPSNYIGITQGADGLHIVGAQDATQAAEMYFVEMTDTGALVNFQNLVRDSSHTVNHIDISIVGHAAFSVPLAYGTYYYKDENEEVHTLVVNRQNPVTVDIAQDIPIDREDVKRANITAYTIENDGSHKVLNNVFYITGYSGNEENGTSTNQTRIEGVFKVADLPLVTDWSTFDTKERLKHKIYYTVSTTKKVTFDLEFNEMKLYSSEAAARAGGDDGVAQGTVTVSVGQTMNYWDLSNECPPIHNWGRMNDWKNGAILYGGDAKTGSGMDFQLGTVDKEKYGILAIEITKYIQDEAGNNITPKYDINNVFHIYHSSSDTPDSVEKVNVDEYKSDYTGYNNGYVGIHDRTVTVSEDGMGTVYDYDVEAGMVYIVEDKSEKNLPRSFVDVDGNTWKYKRTYLETEYVWRDNGIEDRMHVSASYNSESEAYRSIPEVLGKYQDVNGVDRYNGFLEFFVYNIYEAEPIDIIVQKNWKHVNGSNAEAPEGASLTVNLGRYKLVKDEEQPVYGDIVIHHNINIAVENSSGKYYATYKIKQGNKVFRSASFSLDGGSIPNTINFTGLPEGDYTLEITESTNGYTAETSPTSASVHITAGNTIENNTATSETVNTTLTKDIPQKTVKVYINVGQGNAANTPSGNYDQQLEYTFLAGKKIVFTIYRPAGAYEDQNEFKAWAGTYDIPWPEVENSDAWIYTKQDWTYPEALPESGEITINLISNWGGQSFYVTAVAMENEKSSVLTSNNAASNSNNMTLNSPLSAPMNNAPATSLTAVSPTAETPVSNVPGMKYVKDEGWEQKVYLGNGLWEDVVKELDSTDSHGQKYLYYIDSVDEDGFPENTNVTIHDDGLGYVLTSDGDTTLKVTNTIPDEKPKLTIRKVDENGYPLPGAEFTISGGPSGFQTLTFKIDAANATYTTGQLNEGEYIVTETEVPTGYQGIGNFTFKVENNTITPVGTLPSGVNFDDESYSFTVENNPHNPGNLEIVKRWLDFYGNALNEGVSTTVKLVQLVQDQQPKHLLAVKFYYDDQGVWKAVNPPNDAGNTKIAMGRGTAQIVLYWDHHTSNVESITANVPGFAYQVDPQNSKKVTLTIPDPGNGNDTVIVHIKNWNYDPLNEAWPNETPPSIGDITFPNANTPADSYSVTGGVKTITLNSSNHWMAKYEYDNTMNCLLSDSSTKLPTTYEGRECRYMIVEDPVPDGYSVSYSKNNTQGVGQHNQAAITAYNKKTTTDIKLIKVDKENHQIRLAGAQFEIRKLDSRQKGTAYLTGVSTIQTVTTSSPVGNNPGGEATISDLSIGYYEIKETVFPSGFVAAPGKDRFYIKITPQGIFAIEPDETNYPSKWVTRKNDNMLVNDAKGTFTFGNEPARMDINILKVDATNMTTALTGAKFVLKQYNEGYTTLLKTWDEKTVSEEEDTKGTLSFEGLRTGYYELIETQCPAGYIPVNTGLVRFRIVVDTTTNTLKVEFENTSTILYNTTNKTFTIGNTPGVELPSTGGNGILWYNRVGLALILLAGALLIVNRRRAAKERR